MQEIVITPATIIVLVSVFALAVCAFMRLIRRGMCDCKGAKKGYAHCHACAQSKGCKRTIGT